VRVVSQKQKLKRCDSTKVKVYQEAGYDMRKLQNVTWHLEVSGGDQRVEELLRLIEKDFEGKDHLLVPSNLTEMITQDTELIITAKALTRNGDFTEDHETLVIEAQPFTQLGGFSPSYYILAEQGLSFDFKKLFPKCPSEEHQE